MVALSGAAAALAAAPKVLEFIGKVLEWAPAVRAGVKGAREAFEDGLDKVKVMVAEDRDPTEQEWAELNAKTAELREALHTD